MMLKETEELLKIHAPEKCPRLTRQSDLDGEGFNEGRQSQSTPNGFIFQCFGVYEAQRFGEKKLVARYNPSTGKEADGAINEECQECPLRSVHVYIADENRTVFS